MERGRKWIGVGLVVLALAFGLAGCAQDTAGSGGPNGNGQIYTNDGQVMDAGRGAPAGEEGAAHSPAGSEGTHTGGSGGSEAQPTATGGH